MFINIETSVTRQQAKALHPNDWVVLHVKETDEDEDDVIGDIIFVGEEDEISPFTEGKKPQKGYAFYIFRGNNLRELTPIEVVT